MIKKSKRILAMVLILYLIFPFLPCFLQEIDAAVGDGWDLQNFIIEAGIERLDGSKVMDGDTVNVGEELVLRLRFAETIGNSLQMSLNEEGVMIYQLPAVFEVQTPVVDTPILTPGNVVIGYYSIELNGQISVRFLNVDIDGGETAKCFIDNYTNVEIRLTANVVVNDAAEEVNIDFGNQISRKIVAKLEEEVIPMIVVDKSSSYDAKNEVFHFLIQVTALEDVKDVAISDLTRFIWRQEILSKDYDKDFSLFVDGIIWWTSDSTWANTADNKMELMVIPWDEAAPFGDFSRYGVQNGSGKSWELTFGSVILHKGETIYVEYSFDVSAYLDAVYSNYAAARFDGLYDYLHNYVEARANDLADTPVLPAYDNTDNPLNKTQLRKSGRTYFNEEMEKAIDWNIGYGTLDPSVTFVINGAIVTDKLQGGQFIHNGTKAIVTLYDNTGKPLSQTTFTYLDGATDPVGGVDFTFSDDGFVLEIPTDLGDIYYLNVDLINVGVPEIDKNTFFENQLQVFDGNDKKTIGTVEVAPGKYVEPVTDEVVTTKEARLAYDAILYEINVTVPKELYGRTFYIQDWMFFTTDGADLKAVTTRGVNPSQLKNINIYLNGELQPLSASDFGSSGTPITGGAPLDVTILSTEGYYLAMYFSKATSPTNSLWMLEEDSQLTITYELPLDAVITLRSGEKITARDYLGAAENNSIINEVTCFHDLLKTKDRSQITGSFIHKGGQLFNNAKGQYVIDYVVTIPKEMLNIDDEIVPLSLGNSWFRDVFDSRLVYLPKTFYVKYQNEQGEIFYYAPLKTSAIGTCSINDDAVHESGITVNNDSGQLEVNLHELNQIWLTDDDITTATISGNLGESERAALSDLCGFEIHYQLQLKDEAAPDDSGRYILDNVATIMVGGDELSDDYQVDFIPRNRLDKSVVLGKNIASYEIVINPNKQKMNTNSTPILLSDRMVEALSFYSSSFKMLVEVDGVMVEQELVRVSGIPKAVFEYSISSTYTSNDTLMMLLPDQTHMIFSYDTRINGPVGSDVTLINYASLGSIERTTLVSTYRVQDSSASGNASINVVNLLKHDRDFCQITLPGAKFGLYIGAKYVGWEGKIPPTGSELEQSFKINNVTFYYLDAFETNEEGSVSIRNEWLTSSHDVVYALVEYQSPDGYELPQDNTTIFTLKPLTSTQRINLGDVVGSVQLVTDFMMIANRAPINRQVQIRKIDRLYPELVLEGAEFAFYTDQAETVPPGVVPPSDKIEPTILIGNRTFYYAGSGRTDAGGKAIIDAFIDPEDRAIYALVEIVPPAGYALKEEPVIMCFDPTMQTSSTITTRQAALQPVPVGKRNDFSGFVGYSFVPQRDLTVDQIGRPVASGITANHRVRIWDADTRVLLASAVVTPSSPVDEDGFATALLNNMIVLERGKTYIIVSEEFNRGDAWFDVTDGSLPVEDSGSIQIVEGRFTESNGFPIESWAKGKGYVGNTIFFNSSENRVVDISLLEGLDVDPKEVVNFQVEEDSIYAYYVMTNDYIPRGPIEGELKGTKIVIGRPAFETTFTFHLTQLNSNNPSDEMVGGIDEKTTVVTETDGRKQYSFTFGNLPELRDGTYWFKLWEEATSSSEWQYDTTPRIIKLEVLDGKYTATYQGESPNDGYLIEEFVNQYEGDERWLDFTFPAVGGSGDGVFMVVAVVLAVIIGGGMVGWYVTTKVRVRRRDF